MLSTTFHKAVQELAKREIVTVIKKLSTHYKFDYDDAVKMLTSGEGKPVGGGGGEVQKHGFTWEKDIITNVYGATAAELKEIKYTSKMDLPASVNKLGDYDLSVKTCGEKNAICMGDCLRIFDTVNSDNPYHMTTIFYKQNDETNTKKVSHIVEVNLTNAKDILFGTLQRVDIEQLNNYVREVPQRQRPTPEQHKRMYVIRDILSTKGGHLQLNIKCNSTQSRLQCSFNRFNLFLEEHPNRIVEISMSHHFKKGEITPEIVSGRRKFTPKESL